MWPSGKAPLFGSGIRRFESYHPSHNTMSKEVFFSINDCSFFFGKKQLFKDLCLTIHQGDKIALVGKNGVGKTTLLKILSGKNTIDSGEYWVNPKISFGYLKQKEKRNEQITVYNFLQKFLMTL